MMPLFSILSCPYATRDMSVCTFVWDAYRLLRWVCTVHEYVQVSSATIVAVPAPPRVRQLHPRGTIRYRMYSWHSHTEHNTHQLIAFKCMFVVKNTLDSSVPPQKPLQHCVQQSKTSNELFEVPKFLHTLSAVSTVLCILLSL